MTTTVLTDEQKAQFVTDIIDYGTDFVAPLFAVVESIEQAVLQSPETQARMEAYAAAKVREALESLQWISVADRLPDERERVLAFGRIRSTNLGPGKLGISVAWRIADRYFTDGTSNVFGKMLCVTHWMPLPAPPQQ